MTATEEFEEARQRGILVGTAQQLSDASYAGSGWQRMWLPPYSKGWR